MRQVRLSSPRVEQAAWGEKKPAVVTIPVVLEYLKFEPIETVVLTEDAALLMVEELLRAVRVARQVNQRRKVEFGG